MTGRDWTAERFEEHRPRLGAIAHRILGSSSEADDAVQEAWLRFSRADTSGVDSLGAWLTTVVSRVCLTMLQARRTQAQPVAEPAPPEPRAGVAESDPEYEALLADSVGHALLVVLDTLSPAERVAFVLHDVFGIPFDEIAPIVGRSGPATRQLASRARRRVRREDAGGGPDPLRHAGLVDAFLAAARKGDFDALLAVLDPDVVLRADRHAVELGAPAETRGRELVAGFSRRARGARRALLDGAAAVVWTPADRPRVVYSFATGADGITAIDLIADPDRLRGMDLVILEPARW
jgi:RNA polymerase sigma factor (sigma-70 family)